MLPGPDGLALCRWIRGRSSLPVIMLTARGDEADRIVGLELGADDYVTKPFSPRELAARVRTVLRRAGGPSDERRLAFDGLEIDAEPARCGRRQAGAADGAGVRPALVPGQPPAPSLLPHPADGARMGLRVRGRHGDGDRARAAAAREDRGATLRGPRCSRRSGASATGSPRDHLRARRGRGDAGSPGVLAALALRPLPTLRLQLVGLALLASVLPLAGGRPLRTRHVRSEHDLLVLAVAAAASTAALVAAALLLGALDLDAGRRSGGRDGARGRRPHGPRADAARARSRAAGAFNSMAARLEELFDTRARPRRRGEPRPADAAREHAGDARGARGRPGEPERLRAGLRDQVRRSACSSTTCSSWRASTPVRSRSSCATAQLDRSSRCLRALEAEARARRPPARRGGRRGARRAARPSRSSACSSTCSRTRSGTRRQTAPWPCASRRHERRRCR